MDIRSVNSQGELRPYTDDINVEMYDSSNTLMRSELCKLTGINGCWVYNYVVFTVGTYTIKIYEISSQQYLWTNSFSVTSGYALSFFTFTIVPSSPSAWQDFTIKVDLTDGCGNPYVDTVDVTLSATNGISGELVKTTSTASATFNVYCQSPGLNTVIASALLINSNTTFTVLQDLIKFISLSPQVISK